MLSKETIEIGPGTNIPLIIPIKNGESHLSMNLKMLNYFITCTKLKITTIEADQGDHTSRVMGSPACHQVSLLPHSSRRDIAASFTLNGEARFTS